MFSKDEIRATVTKLNNANYAIWKMKMELILIKEDLWEVIEGPAKKDNPLWVKRDGQAKACIGLMVEDDQLYHLKEADTAKKCWDNLKNHYEKPSLSTRVFVMKTICKMQLQEDEKMESHINDMMRYIEQLNIMGDPLSESWSVAMLLRSLPDSYDPLIVALEAREGSALGITFVKGKLIEEARRKVHKKESMDETSVMKVNSRRTEIKINKKTDIKCFYCEKFGHMKKDCRFYKEFLQKKKRNNVGAVQNTTQQCFWFGTTSKYDWFIDSGATCHISNQKSFFQELNEQHTEAVNVANGFQETALGKGFGVLNAINDNNQVEKISVMDVLFVPGIASNLLSVRKLTEKGYSVQFEKNTCKIVKNGTVVAIGDLCNDLYKLRIKMQEANVVSNDDCKNCIHEWHRKMGHRDYNTVKNTLKDLNIKVKECNKDIQCEVCLMGKMTRKPFPKVTGEQSKEILDLIHTDVAVMNERTPSGNKYFVSFIDDFSRYCIIYLMKNKNEVITKIKDYFCAVKVKFNRTPKILRSDRGGEYLNSNIKSYLSKLGTHHQLTAPYTPQQNGVAERRNRYLAEMLRCMLEDANMPNKFWGEAVLTANFVQNRLPTRSKNLIPFEIWEGKKVDMLQFEIFGADAHVLIPAQCRKKLSKKTEVLKFVGYSDESKALRFLDQKKMRVVISRDYKVLRGNSRYHVEDKPTEEEVIITWNGPKEENTQDPIEDEFYSADEDETTLTDEAIDNILSESHYTSTPQTVRRSTRSNLGKAPDRYACLAVECEEPKTYKEAINCVEKSKWIKAMNEEMESLTRNKTWQLKPLPEGRKAIGCKWIFKIKRGSDGKIDKYKARLVAQGYSQKFGVDYDEVFAPVVKQTTLRTFLTVAGMLKYTVRQYDIKTAFLNGVIEEEIYMRQPPGYEESSENLVCKLEKSLYGLKQSARCWNTKLVNVLKQKGYIQGEADPCLLKIKSGKNNIYILIYVDDILVTAQNDDDFAKIEEILEDNFEVTKLGIANFYLGIKIEREEDNFYSISQEKYIDKIIMKSGLQDAKTSRIPMDIGYINIDRNKCTFLESNDIYRQLIGCLLFLCVNTRPDIAAVVSILSQRVSNPTKEDWVELKRLIRYLKGTKHFKLKLGNLRSNNLIVFSDADWAQNRNDRKSNTGYLFKFNGAAISWTCRKQQCVALSSTEAEYIALAETAKELIWVRKLLEDFEMLQEEPVIVYEDNQSCIKLVDNEKISRRTKHVDTRYHFINDLKNRKILDIKYCPTEDMEADIFTKPLSFIKFEKFRCLMNWY